MVVFRRDPCGIICILLTYLALFYADYACIFHIVLPSMSNTLWGAVCVVVFNMVIFLALVSHVRAVVSDPGMIPVTSAMRDCDDPEEERRKKSAGWSMCMKCDTYRPPRAHHCRICRRCIRRMDHHCPWINNCVGEYNQKFFLQFLFYVGMASVLAVTMTVASWVIQPDVDTHVKHIKLAHSVVLMVESLLFGLFVLAIGCDQVSSIINDETAVEHVKKEGPYRYNRTSTEMLREVSSIINDETAVEHVKKEGPYRYNRTSTEMLREVFGNGHMLLWLCPTQLPTHDHLLHPSKTLSV